MMGTLARPLDALSLFLFRLALIGAVAAVLVMVFSAGWQVIARYALNAPPIWTEELARRAMVWAGMLGASCAANTEDNHFRAVCCHEQIRNYSFIAFA